MGCAAGSSKPEVQVTKVNLCTPVVRFRDSVETDDGDWMPESGPDWEVGKPHGQIQLPTNFNGIVPIAPATPEFFSYYGAILTSQCTEMEKWVLNPEHGPGALGLERHEFAHLECPLDEDSGILLLAKLEGKDSACPLTMLTSFTEEEIEQGLDAIDHVLLKKKQADDTLDLSFLDAHVMAEYGARASCVFQKASISTKKAEMLSSVEEEAQRRLSVDSLESTERRKLDCAPVENLAISRSTCGRRGPVHCAVSKGAGAALVLAKAPDQLHGMPPRFSQKASNYIFVEQMPHHFTVTAVDSANRIMAMEHVRDHVYGIQWHPEVIGDQVGRSLVDRIFSLVGQPRGCSEGELPVVKLRNVCLPADADKEVLSLHEVDLELRKVVKELVESAGKKAAVELGKVLAGKRKDLMTSLRRFQSDPFGSDGDLSSACACARQELREVAAAWLNNPAPAG
eukprot:s648_g10.t1